MRTGYSLSWEPSGAAFREAMEAGAHHALLPVAHYLTALLWLLTLLVGLGGAAVVVLLTLYFTGSTDAPTMGVIFGACLGIGALALFQRWPISFIVSATIGNPSSEELYRAELNSDGVTISNSGSHWQMSWRVISAVIAGELGVIIVYGATAVSIPDGAFASPKEKDDMVAQMQRWQEAAQ